MKDLIVRYIYFICEGRIDSKSLKSLPFFGATEFGAINTSLSYAPTMWQRMIRKLNYAMVSHIK